jgi:hypothetical protein
MLRPTRTILAMFALAVGVSSLACGGTQLDIPQQQAVTTSAKSGLQITSAISSVSLGDSYANVQLAFLADAATDSASVEIVSVTLVDATTGSVVDTLESSTPQVWNGGGYTTWNQRVTPGGDLKASYHLTAPDWSKIDQGAPTGKTAYSRSFKLRVTLRIDGIDVPLESTELHREPQMQT